MTENATEPTEPQTAIEVSDELGLPSTTVYCPYCVAVRSVQELFDGHDIQGSARAPFGCLTCGCEFVADRPATALPK